MEELAVEIELGPLLGVYSRPDERIVLIVFTATLAGTPQPTEEATEVRAFARTAIPWDGLAFWSTARALEEFLALSSR